MPEKLIKGNVPWAGRPLRVFFFVLCQLSHNLSVWSRVGWVAEVKRSGKRTDACFGARSFVSQVEFFARTLPAVAILCCFA